MERLTIRRVGVTELTDTDTFVVALAEEEVDGVGRVFMLQQSLSFDEQDEDLGMATYCLSSADGPTTYGGVSSCVLRASRLTLVLSSRAATELSTDRELQFDLRVSPGKIAELCAGLARVFEGDEQRPTELVLEGPDPFH